MTTLFVSSVSYHIYSCENNQYIVKVATGLRDFRPSPTQTELYSHRRWLKACHFGFLYKWNCTIRIAKTKALIKCAVATSRFSLNEALLFGIKHFSVCVFFQLFSAFL